MNKVIGVMKACKSVMKTNRKKQGDLNRGMTLLELTVVILVLIMLISVLFIGATAYKRGANRAACLLNIRKAQQAVRSVQNLTEKSPGDSGLIVSEVNEFAGIDLATLRCPADADYTFINDGKFPPLGEAALKCDLELSERHIPEYIERW